MTKSIFFLVLFLTVTGSLKSNPKTNIETKNGDSTSRWNNDKAQKWYAQQPWLRGCNFNPSTAINQLEMWQAESFDPVTINRELGWAKNIGMNCMRVYLHHLAWEIDPVGFKTRMKKYLTIADKNGIKTVFVFLDDCWNPTYAAGKQPEPKPGVHNSGWVKDPGELLNQSPLIMKTLELYVKDILTTFKKDRRILLWDLYNEPGVYNEQSLMLLTSAFKWARSINPSQPLTSAVFSTRNSAINSFQVNNSDVITYHNYDDPSEHIQAIDTLKRYNRPLLCTEYMARKHNSLFSNIMPLLKKNHIAAINWGLVAGKSNTKYAWDEPIADGSEPKVWFHEIFYPDGKPYKQDEVDLIKRLSETEY
jgi:Glycosyl hydrolases family 2, TIM barrel domain